MIIIMVKKRKIDKKNSMKIFKTQEKEELLKPDP